MTKIKRLASFGSRLIRLWMWTVRFKIHDPAGVLNTPPEKPLLWAFWHNRLFVMPTLFERFFPGRKGAALASPSKDGEIIASLIERFGIRPIRGSSSRRGAAALVEMKRAIQDGYIMALTPDGPRGPRYHVNPGIIKLAQITGGLILPIEVVYSRFWRLKSWDGFMIPWPFSTITVTFHVLHPIPPTASEDEFEAQRLHFQSILTRGEGAGG